MMLRFFIPYYHSSIDIQKRGNLSYLFFVHPQGLEPWTH